MSLRTRADLSTRVGPVALASPVMTAAGTSGHGAELGAYFELARLGAVVVKSLCVDPWPGNPAPRVHGAAGGGMLNSVGLQGPGIAAWIEEELPALEAAEAPVIVSIWGRYVADFAAAAEALAPIAERLLAVEVNVSCPNLDDRSALFAHSPSATAEVLAVTAACGRPRLAKLSPNAANLVEIAAAAGEAGAAGVVLVNTVLGLALDAETRRPVLGAGRGGLSGPPVRPVALRAVFDVHEALPELPIVGVGGVSSGLHAVELLMAGASAVQVGTATLADPHAPVRVLEELSAWCERHGVTAIDELVGAAHV